MKSLLDYMLPGERVYVLENAYPAGATGTVLELDKYDGTVLILLDKRRTSQGTVIYPGMWFSINELELEDDL